MEGNDDFVPHGILMRPALADGTVAVGELDAAGTVAHELDDARRGANFVGVSFFDRISRIHGIREPPTAGQALPCPIM
jgi:hypothetical protein